VPGQPLARQPLRPGDVGAGHGLGKLGAITTGFDIAAHGRQVEPLVRGDDVDVDITAGAVHQAELEQGVRRPRLGGALDDIARCELNSCHNTVSLKGHRKRSADDGKSVSSQIINGKWNWVSAAKLGCYFIILSQEIERNRAFVRF
jgi:hypothetical protein